jgi:uncharacterized damage-inducible protein DinB
MTNGEFFVQRWEAEQAAFRKVLAALPPDKLDYTPHERSTSAGNLAFQLAYEQGDLVELLKTGVTAFVPQKRPDTLDEILALWDRNTSAAREALNARDESRWSGPATFKVGDEVAWEDTLQNMLWGFLFDMVHHRGQLSSYLRPMGGKVPAIYGPSGDAEH